MSRPLRIDYPGAWHHVMNRGRRGDDVFRGGRDYGVFLDLLKECAEQWRVNVAAYCLMPNHYHLLVQTPDANLSRFMRHLNGVYTQWFNRKYQLDGQLFRGRYKSIIIDSDAYLMEVLRYIHRNPVRAGMVERPADYEWSSHRGYVSRARKWDWIYKSFALSMLNAGSTSKMRAYNQFMSDSDSEEITEVYAKKNFPWILGSPGFVESIKERFYQRKLDAEIPDSKRLAPDGPSIINAVCGYYRIDKDKLLKPVRGKVNEPRDAAIYFVKKLAKGSHDDIGKEFGLNTHSSVSSAIGRVKERIQTDSRFRKRLKDIQGVIAKRQTKI